MVKSPFRPSLFIFSKIKLVSKDALCATRKHPLQNSKNAGRITSISGSFITISCVMLVSLVISSEILCLGFTKAENLSITFPPATFTAPISIILQFLGPNPVVSKSKTTAGSVSFCPSSILTAGVISFTR